MDILIFDMDGVLLDANGYHRALQETVRLIGEQLSLDNIKLSREQIYRFESIGISSEWHSSALCMAVLKIELLSGASSPSLDLEELFSILEDQPLVLPAIDRCLSAIELLCKDRSIDPKVVESTITEGEDINRSVTMQWFQELVLGSESYQAHYHKPGLFSTQSYLKTYDVPLLTSKNAKKISDLADTGGYGAAIMTNRPSSGPDGLSGSPEAELGLDLVLLPKIPLIGYGDISWLAESIQVAPGTLIKPNATHALAAIAGSMHMEKEQSLRYSIMDPAQWPNELLEKLQGGSITVFEDTAAGLASVWNAGEALRKAGVDVEIRSIGIAKEETKQAALESHGAEVFPDINSALFNLEQFWDVERRTKG